MFRKFETSALSVADRRSITVSGRHLQHVGARQICRTGSKSSDIDGSAIDVIDVRRETSFVSGQSKNGRRQVGAVVNSCKRQLVPGGSVEFVGDVPTELSGSGRQWLSVECGEAWSKDGQRGVEATHLGRQAGCAEIRFRWNVGATQLVVEDRGTAATPVAQKIG